jgi:hypothetical protein
LSVLAIDHPHTAEFELELLIREARRRRRRRCIRLVLIAFLALGGAAVITAAVSGWFSALTRDAPAGRLTGGTSTTRCPVSPARFVANTTFSATVIGDGRVRLGVGNGYQSTRQAITVYHHGRRGWGGIEALWIVRRGAPLALVMRGVALGKQGPIEVQPSDSGLSPGTGSLQLSGARDVAANQPAPGSLWVRTGGCYAVDVSGRGFSERLVFDVAIHAMPS